MLLSNVNHREVHDMLSVSEWLPCDFEHKVALSLLHFKRFMPLLKARPSEPVSF